MKSIKEKAKAYDKAIKRLEDIETGKCQKPFMFTEGLFDYIFPELKESEDERIRKVLVDYFKRYKEQEECGIKTFYGIPTDNIIAWLEKQGEQNPACSEEDEDIINKILCICDDFEKSFEISPSSTKVIKEDVDKIDNWLKSLKERYTWKPSDEQMEALACALSLAKNCGEECAFDLRTLHEQLKKLREE